MAGTPLNVGVVLVRGKPRNLKEVVEELTKAMPIKVKPEVLVPVLSGGDVAIFHTRSREIKEPVAGVASLGQRVEGIRFVFVLVSPEGDPDAHLLALSQVAKAILRRREELEKARDPEKIKKLLEAP